jgi:hypothetical protein
VTEYAQTIAVQDGVVQSDGTPNIGDVVETKGDYGLRTAFNSHGKEIEIATNYLPIRLANSLGKIYIYEIEMVSHYNQKGGAVLL